MNNLYIKNGDIVTWGVHKKADITVKDGKIYSITEGNVFSFPEIEASGCIIVPGFIDIHTHGAYGVDVNAADYKGFEMISKYFASQGVTSWLCSILTDTKEQTLKEIKTAVSYIENGNMYSRLAGIHLEGPCLSVKYKGAMPEWLLMKEADIELFSEYQKAAKGNIKYVTIAPEIPGAIDLIPALNEMGIKVSIGHSDAGYDDSIKAIDAGAQAATHLGNAERLFHQHDPSIFGAALERDCYIETISDGRHLHPATIRLYIKTAGLDRVIAITDSIMATGLPDGDYMLGVNPVTVVGGDAKLSDTGVRAGSTLTMIEAYKNLLKFTKESPENIIALLTKNPSDLMSFDRGEIKNGKYADLTILDKNLNVRICISEGKIIYKR